MTKYNVVGAYHETDWKFQYPEYENLDNFHDDKLCQYVLLLVNNNQTANIFTVHGTAFDIFAGLINQGRLNKNDVTFTILDEDHNTTHPTINNEGFFENYHFGFFEMGYLDGTRLPENKLY